MITDGPINSVLLHRKYNLAAQASDVCRSFGANAHTKPAINHVLALWPAILNNYLWFSLVHSLLLVQLLAYQAMFHYQDYAYIFIINIHMKIYVIIQPLPDFRDSLAKPLLVSNYIPYKTMHQYEFCIHLCCTFTVSFVKTSPILYSIAHFTTIPKS